MFSSSLKEEKTADVVKVALKHGDTAAGNSEEFADKSKITQDR